MYLERESFSNLVKRLKLDCRVNYSIIGKLSTALNCGVLSFDPISGLYTIRLRLRRAGVLQFVASKL
ncbi:hypothetical protein Ccrd_025194 [Cynara cardunculus var. scolymus]|uniref:Uncharacterized protein n=1 Tax=Cynara cardunculus var. scolymus TaxID=59895 RepID=A0A103XB85_CYNCS|nr:hypothetical protein Ccrd_025194 [Cynara cardunculus var. scolymus]